MIGFLRGINLYLFILLLLGALCYLMISLPVRIRFLYEGKGKNHSFLLRFEIFGGRVGIGTKFPSTFPRLTGKTGMKYFSRNHPKSRPQTLVSVNNLRPYYGLLKNFFLFTKDFLKKSTCKRFAWHTVIGCGDYAATGMATGALWVFKGLLYGYLSRILRISSSGHKIRVVPDFDRPRFDSSLDCILETRSGHIMIELIRFLIWWQKLLGHNN